MGLVVSDAVDWQPLKPLPEHVVPITDETAVAVVVGFAAGEQRPPA
jgi:hypothetical protein